MHQVGCSLHDYIDMHSQQNLKKNHSLCLSLAGPLSNVSSGRILHTYSAYNIYIAYTNKKGIRIQRKNNSLFDYKYQLSIPTYISLFPTVLWTK